ncbi:MAG: molybdopterin molybdotransferase MoeA [Chloroflexi bacterium]|nr:molybdopterin molybdotransferase MoeA [Chloroflexota bacterium]
MLDLETAQERILGAIEPLGIEAVPLRAAAGRIAGARIPAPMDLPPFDNSAMDGYAVRAADVAEAGPAKPVALRLIGTVAAGAFFQGTVAAGTCVRIFTGSPLPAGADAVVMQEDTRVDPARPEVVDFLDAAKPCENVRSKGGDVRKGTVLAEAGEKLGVGRISLLASSGLTEVLAGRQPVAGLLATGSELREGGQTLAPGQIYESNRVALAALLDRLGAVPRVFPLVNDTLHDTRSALEAAFAECDAVVSSGGVSVGEWDFVKRAFQEMGGELDFWKVAIKPGKPFVFGRWRGKFLFGLPGNPVSATVTFLLLVRPAILRFQGARQLELPAHPGVLIEPLANPGERRHFVRVTVNTRSEVRLSGVQASHVLSSLAEANGLVDVPAQTTLPAGSSVQVLRWE